MGEDRSTNTSGMMKLDPLKWVKDRKMLAVNPSVTSFVKNAKLFTFVDYNTVITPSNVSSPHWFEFTTVGPHHSQNWCLYFFPNGVDKSCEGFVSFYLFLSAKTCNNVLKTKVHIQLHSKVDENLTVNGFLMKVGDICGMKKWNKLTSGQMKVVLSIMIKESMIVEHKLDYTDLLFGTPGDIILVGTDWKYPCHKQVLCDCSPVFRAMFQHNMEESKTSTVNITDIEAPVMKSLLTFMYTGSVDLPNIVHKVLIAADKYDIETLKTYCQDYLLSNLSLMNIMESLDTADQCNLEALKTECLKYLHLMPEQVMKNNSYKLFEEKHSLLCKSINDLVLNNMI